MNDVRMGLPRDAASFLDQFKDLVRRRDFDRRLVGWIDRAGRVEELGDLGLTMNGAVELIETELLPSHCQRGPEPDDHASTDGAICIFRCPIPGAGDAYVKLGLRISRTRRGELRGVIWSFKRWE